MPTCSEALAKIKSEAIQIVSYYNKHLNHMSDAWTHWGVGDDHEAIQDILYAISDVAVAASSFGGWSPYDWEGCIHYYLDNCIGAVDMAAILAAMLEAEPDEVEYFVGLVDAYRQSIWNRPFNKQFYAALARGFMVWP